MVLHDFRQAVQSLWGLAPIVGDIGSSPPSTDPRKLEELISGLASALTGMIDAVTAIAKLETGEISALHTIVPLSDLLSKHCQSLDQLALQRSTSLVLGSCDGAARTDANHAGALLRGCLLTALKLTSGGTIEITANQQDGQAAIVVAYSGIDPGPALRRTAFVDLPGLASSPSEPFVGLGLALCGRLATALDGTLGVGIDEKGRHLLQIALPLAP